MNTREHWLSDHVLTDVYTEEEQILVEKILDQTNLCSLMESIYEPCRGNRTPEQIKVDLIKAGVEIDPEFQAWAEIEILN